MVDHGDGTKRCWFANVGVVIDQFDRSVNSHSTHFLTFLIESEAGIRTLALLELIDVGVLEISRSLFESPQSLFEACADQARLLGSLEHPLI
jgi:hypothetical protein